MRIRYPVMIAVYFLLPITALLVWNWKYVAGRELFVLGALCLFSVGWDIWATDHGMKKIWLWRFNEKTISGWKLFTHPIEEYFFGVCAPIWMVLLWQVAKRGFLEGSYPDAWFAGVMVLLGTIAGFFMYRWQTASTEMSHDRELR